MTAHVAGRYLDGVATFVRDLGRQPFAEAAGMLADAVSAGGMIYLFGSGHSQLVAIEACSRAGGLAPMWPLVDLALSPILPDRSTQTERLAGYGAVTAAQWDVRDNDAIVVISHSGINPVPVEFAQLMRARSIPVIAITSVSHSQRATPRTRDGLRLLDVADIVIDTGAPYGDASVQLAEHHTGAVSGILASASVHALVAQVVDELISRGVTPPLMVSGNTTEGDSANDAVTAAYRSRHVLR